MCVCVCICAASTSASPLHHPAACQACCTGRALGATSPTSLSPPRSPPRQARREAGREAERHAAERHTTAAAAVGAAAAATPSVPLLPVPLQPVPRAQAQHRSGQAGGQLGDLGMCGVILLTPTLPHLLHPLTCYTPSSATPPYSLPPLIPLRPLNRCVEAVAAQPACNFAVPVPSASLLKMVQACASRVRGVCTAYYTHTLHLPASTLATCWPSSRSPSSRRRAAPPSGQWSASAPTRLMPPLRAKQRSRRASRASALPPPALLPHSPHRTACVLRPGGGRPPRRRPRPRPRRWQKSRRRALRGGRPRRRRRRVSWQC